MASTSRRTQPMPKGWAKKRRRILARDAAICYVCGRAGANEVDHVVAASRGGTDDDSNLKAIHKGCHAHKTATESRGGSRLRERERHPGLVA